MRLSIDHFIPNNPLSLIVQSKFSYEFRNTQLKSGENVNIVRISVQFQNQWPYFLDLSPNETLFCKKIVTDSPLIWNVGRSTPVTFICECPPPIKELIHVTVNKGGLLRLLPWIKQL